MAGLGMILLENHGSHFFKKIAFSWQVSFVFALSFTQCFFLSLFTGPFWTCFRIWIFWKIDCMKIDWKRKQFGLLKMKNFNNILSNLGRFLEILKPSQKKKNGCFQKRYNANKRMKYLWTCFLIDCFFIKKTLFWSVLQQYAKFVASKTLKKLTLLAS